jgi:hypothetical protein
MTVLYNIEVKISHEGCITEHVVATSLPTNLTETKSPNSLNSSMPILKQG